eukprot:m.792944 g.792944  ORF g.792944 m.792944 type:complete len:320 (-) comp23333_c0_seq5:512-1471(-)
MGQPVVFDALATTASQILFAEKFLEVVEMRPYDTSTEEASIHGFNRFLRGLLTSKLNKDAHCFLGNGGARLALVHLTSDDGAKLGALVGRLAAQFVVHLARPHEIRQQHHAGDIDNARQPRPHGRCGGGASTRIPCCRRYWTTAHACARGVCVVTRHADARGLGSKAVRRLHRGSARTAGVCGVVSCDGQIRKWICKRIVGGGLAPWCVVAGLLGAEEHIVLGRHGGWIADRAHQHWRWCNGSTSDALRVAATFACLGPSSFFLFLDNMHPVLVVVGFLRIVLILDLHCRRSLDEWFRSRERCINRLRCFGNCDGFLLP